MSTDVNMEHAILESATELFLRKGFNATSTTEIARNAGCNQALVHYYYRTKERLFEAIFQEKIKVLVAALLDVESNDLPFFERLAKRIESHFEAIRKDSALPLFFLSEISANPDRIDSIKSFVGDLPDRAIQKMHDELNEEMSKGTIRPTAVKDLLMTIVSMNIMGFLGAPLFKLMTRQTDEAYEAFLDGRKKENVRVVLQSLKP